MQIDSIRRTKGYKKDGALIGLIEVSLPQIISDDDYSFINDYYAMMADSVLKAADSCFASSVGFVKIKISFSVVKDELISKSKRLMKSCKSPLFIRRVLAVSSQGFKYSYEFTDCFDVTEKVIKA